MTDLQDLRTAIDTKLNTLVGVGKPLVEVKNFHTLENSGFPYVTFEPSSLDSDFEDTCNNLRNYTFDVFIYQETTSITGGRQVALDILIDSFNQVINLFDEDYTLGGIATQIQAVGGDFGQIVNESGPTLFANIKINTQILVDIK